MLIGMTAIVFVFLIASRKRRRREPTLKDHLWAGVLLEAPSRQKLRFDCER